MVHKADNHDIPVHMYLQKKLKTELSSTPQRKANNWGYLDALVTTVCIVVPNIFSTIIAFPPPHIKLFITSNAMSRKHQGTAHLTGHSKIVVPHYGVCFMSPFLCLKFGGGSHI